MGFIIQTIITGVIALIAYPFSPTVAEWLVWSIYLFFSVTLLVKAMEYKKRFKSGESLKERDIMGMSTFPPEALIVMLILGVFLFLDVSKLHILWIMLPVSAMFFIYDYFWGKHWVKTMDPKVMHQNEDA